MRVLPAFIKCRDKNKFDALTTACIRDWKMHRDLIDKCIEEVRENLRSYLPCSRNVRLNKR